MNWRRPTAAEDESWTMEGFEALQALDRSRRKVWIGLVGSPAAAWLWADTIALSRAFEAGRTSPPRGGSAGGELVGFLWYYFAMGLEGIVGRTGLHVLFMLLVASMMGVGLWGSFQRRDLDRRGVTARALRHEGRARRRWLQAVQQGGELAGRGQRPAWTGALSTLLQMLLLGRRLLPLASIGWTAFLAWTALAR